MKNKVRMLFAVLLAVTMLTACGEDPELTQFRKSVDDFCTKVSEIDTSINNIDAQSEEAATELLEYLDELDLVFQSFAKLDFPEEFDYLENLAVESSDYMTEAVSSYHDAYSNGSYNEYMAEYASENYARAYKRIQIIISFLHGEEPNDADLTIEYPNPDNE
ncbi:MAG: hypothetical protein ACI4AB_08990 [Acetatifactor sp.]